MEMGAIGIAFLLVGATLLIHYEVLRLTSLRFSNTSFHPRVRILGVLTMALLSHLIQVLLYALVYYWMTHSGQGWGGVNGSGILDLSDAFYFSITSYTTLGIGDLFPQGPIRLVSGIEALNGLVMVTWTASFTYVAMEKFWQLHQHPPQ